MRGGKGIIGSMVSKLGEETQSRWFLYFGEALGKEVQEAFIRCLIIEEKATEIFWHQKMAEAWLRRSQEIAKTGRERSHR